MVGEYKRSWDKKLKYALWVDRTTVKRVIGKALFELVYGKKCRLPINLQIPIYDMLQQCTSNHEEFQEIIGKLVELDEVRRMEFLK